MNRGRALCGVAVGLALTACSVSTPRHGYTVYSNGAPVGTGAQAPSGGQQPGGGAPLPGSGTTGSTSVGASGTGGTTGSSGTGSSGGGSGAGTTGSVGGGSSTGATTGGGSGGSSAVGVTKDTIKIAMLGDYNGVYQAFFNNYYDNGIQAWVSDVNGRSGIHGRKVSVRNIDDASSSSGGVAACQQVADGGYFMAIAVLGLGGADLAEANCLDQKGIPLIIVQPSAINGKWRNVFSLLTPVTYAAPFAKFIPDVVKDHSGKVGVMYATDQLNTAKGKAFVAAAQAAGLKVVDQETYPPNETNFAAQNTRMSRSGATSVAFFGGIEYLSAKKGADAIGFAPHWVGTEWAADDTVAACQSCYQGQTDARWWSAADSPGYKHFKEVAAKYGYPKGGGDTGTTVASYYGFGRLVEQVLVNAGPNPTRPGIAAAVGALGSYNNGILALSYAPGQHSATVKLWPITCCTNNLWTTIGPPRSEF